MILAVDIGNTSCLFAEVSSSGKPGKSFRLPTKNLKTRKVFQTIQKKLSRIEAVVIASVVPQAGNELRKKLPALLSRPVVLLGKDIPVPIKNRYRNPKQVGIDRLVNALAAHKRHHRPCVIIDFGTAITLDAVSAKGEYLGGVIAPGIEISLDALFQKTALLPKIRLQHTSNLIGRDTVESIRIGCSTGIGGLCDRLALKIKKMLGKRTLVVATGGYAKFMKNYCNSIDLIDDDLTVRGIALTFLNSSKNIFTNS